MKRLFLLNLSKLVIRTSVWLGERLQVWGYNTLMKTANDAELTDFVQERLERYGMVAVKVSSLTTPRMVSATARASDQDEDAPLPTIPGTNWKN